MTARETEGVWMVRIGPFVARSKYRFEPYWHTDTPLPLEVDTRDEATR